MKKKKLKPNKLVDANKIRNDAVALHQDNKINEAESLYKKLLKLLPNDTTSWTNLGTIEYQRGNLKDAIKFIDNSLKLDPKQPYAYNNRGNILKDMNLSIESLDSYNKGLALNGNIIDINYNKAIILHELNRIDEALVSYTKTIELDDTNIKSYINRGNILHQLNRTSEAILDYDKVIELLPNFALAYTNRGIIHQGMNNIDKALSDYATSISIEPSTAAYSNRGNIYQDKHMIIESIEDYNSAIAIDPNFYIAHGNKANAMLSLRRLDEAEISYNEALSIEPNFADSLWNKSILLLLFGQYEEGLKLFENRWISALKNYKREFDKPLWLGQASLAGKTIYIYPEQGLGDFLQFCRYLPMLDTLEAKVIVEVPQLISIELIKSLSSKATFVTSESNTIKEFDYHCPIMSLPCAFNTTIDTIPADIPYLYADETKKQYWSDKLGPKTKPRIGLVWSGGFRPDQPETWTANARRNIKLKNLECFKDIDAEFYSIQKGAAPEQELIDLISQNWDGPIIISYADELIDFGDTAAFLSNLDLVISVDTSTAHVAGAIGIPVWIFNRFDSCWRWLLNRTDSPWYPTVTLFNQKVTNEWDAVINEMHEKLKTFNWKNI